MDEDLSMLKHVDMRLFPCRCCGQSHITAPFASILRALNEALEEKGWAVQVNSGYRCEKHNAKIGGHVRSRHMSGEAVDLDPLFPSGVTPAMLKQFINEKLGVNCDYQGGLGLYTTFVHIDIGTRSRWNG